jgi:hypothetical protein
MTTIVFGAINSPLATSAANDSLQELADRVSALIRRAFRPAPAE